MESDVLRALIGDALSRCRKKDAWLVLGARR